MDNFNRRLICSIRFTKDSALKVNILENKCKREVAAAPQVIDNVDWSHEKAKNIVASIV